MRSATKSLNALILGGVAVLLAACADRATAPATRGLPPGAPRPDVIIDTMAPDSTSADFTVTPTGGLFTMGPHAVFFPDHSICDPSTSGYGADTWDQPCTPLDSAIHIHAEVRSENGRAWVEFSPALRFVPTDDPNQYVWMMMRSSAASTADSSTYAYFGILWAPDTASTAIDEAASDATLQTYLDTEHGIAFRRIKHFSWYTVPDGYVSVGGVSSMVSPVLY